MGQSMAGLPFGLFQGQTAGSGALGKEGMGHMAQMGMTHTPAGRVPNMDMAWQRTMSGGTDMFARTASAAGFPSMVGQEASQGLMTAMGHWDPAALGGTGNVAMDVWGGMHGGMHASMPHHAGLHNFGFSHEHMPMMAPSMYAPHGLQQHGLQMAAPMATGRPHLSDAPEDTGKGKKGRGKNKANKSRAMPSDAEVRPVLSWTLYISHPHPLPSLDSFCRYSA